MRDQSEITATYDEIGRNDWASLVHPHMVAAMEGSFVPPRGPRSQLVTRLAAAAWLAPGIVVCIAITLASMGAQFVEERTIGHPYIEALVVAILVGMLVRALWMPGARWQTGIAFSAKQLLEVAVMLLGASISLKALVASGPLLLGSIFAVVAIAILASFGICRVLGLPIRMAILVACGNSICGNSAIAAVAPVIGADGDDIASSISFTAVLGVLMVLGLPLLIPVLYLSAKQYGILAGLTVYAVPQVLAATVPAGLVSTQIGTLVKLVRVLTLGPVVVALSLVAPRLPGARGRERDEEGTATFDLLRLVPWFILGFMALAVLRSLGLVPNAAIAPITKIAGILTIVSMAALGLGVDLRVIGRVGGRVTAAVTLSLVFLLLLSIGLIRGLGLGL